MYWHSLVKTNQSAYDYHAKHRVRLNNDDISLRDVIDSFSNLYMSRYDSDDLRYRSILIKLATYRILCDNMTPECAINIAFTIVYRN